MPDNEEKYLPAEGLYMGPVKVGPKGQIVIPKEVRDIFSIKPGDSLLLLADIKRGIAIQQYGVLKKIVNDSFDNSLAREEKK